VWRGLWARVRAVLQESGLPAVYWPSAAGYVNDCRNALLVRGGKATPLEKFCGRKPDLSRFKPFSCFGYFGYAHIPKDARPAGSKLEPRAVKGQVLGFNEGEKGWVMLLGDGEVAISQSVIFAETAALPAAARPLRLAEEEEEPRLDGTALCGGGESDAAEAGGGASKSSHRDVEGPDDGVPDDAPDDDGSTPRAAPGGAPGDAPGGARDGTTPGSARAQRASRLPGRLEGFQVGTASAGSAGDAPEDPGTFEEAMSRPEAALWDEAVTKEFLNMESNGAWELGTPPRGTKVISTKMVFKVKVDPDGAITKYKDRLVARGFMEGLVSWAKRVPEPDASGPPRAPARGPPAPSAGRQRGGDPNGRPAPSASAAGGSVTGISRTAPGLEPGRQPWSRSQHGAAAFPLCGAPAPAAPTYRRRSRRQASMQLHCGTSAAAALGPQGANSQRRAPGNPRGQRAS
jgi:hypothetical protein